MACPNIRSKEWKDLVAKIGVFEAFKEFVKNGEQIPSADNYNETFKGTNATLKVFDALTNNKIQGFYNRFYNSDPNKFYQEVTSIAGKQQTELLKDYNNRNSPQTLNDMISGILSELSYTVQVNNENTGEFVVYDTLNDPTPSENRFHVLDQGGRTLFVTNDRAEAERQAATVNDTPVGYRGAYADMSVPGGTNYKNSEIRTPEITPSIKGHAQFASDKGIGWFRSDDKGREFKKVKNVGTGSDTIEQRGDQWVLVNDALGVMESSSSEKGLYDLLGLPFIDYSNTPKTRRILEIQSDLFQKGRDKQDLVQGFISSERIANLNFIRDDLNEKQKIDFDKEVEQFRDEARDMNLQEDDKLPQSLAIKQDDIIKKYEYLARSNNPKRSQNDFLQLLNKENNWVTFFVKSIIQDSARLGYEKVVFPSGDTAAKVEGHTTLEQFIASREPTISKYDKVLSNENTFFTTDDRESYRKDGDNYYASDPETGGGEYEITKEEYEKERNEWLNKKKAEAEQFRAEVTRARGPEGLGAFSKIAKFYQITIQNILKKQGYNPVEITDEYDNKWFEVQIDTQRDTSTIYFQKKDSSTTLPSKASPSTLKKVNEFLDRIGVQVKGVDSIIMNGRKVDINGIADALRGLIVVVYGKEDVALTEEAMHLAVEMIEQKNPALFKDMMNRISSYNLFNEVFNEYKDISFYKTKDGKPDVIKLKKETIAKVLTQTVINKNEGSNEKPELLVQTRTWWQKIVDFLKGLFNKAEFNPFEEVATQVLSGENLGSIGEVQSSSGVFAQISGDPLYSKLTDIDKNISRVGDTYEVNGTKLKRSIFTEVLDFYKKRLGARADKAFTDFKKEDENKIKQDIQDILDRYIDENGIRRASPEPHANPSAINPTDNTFYNTLEVNFKERLDTYPPGTRFLKGINIYNGTNTAGTVDFIAILPDNRIDILQFKAPETSSVASDVARYRQEAYNTEIEAIRRILQSAYNISRNQFRFTRTIPIRATYVQPAPGTPAIDLDSISIGNVNVELIKDDLLLPIPSISEGTGNEKFDRFINRLRGLARKLADERVAPEKRGEKTQRVAELFAAIRKLQVQGNAEGVISSAKTILKRQRELYTQLKDKIDLIDISKATIKELNKVADDIMDEKDQIEIYKDLHRVFKEIFTDGSTESLKYLEEAKDIAEDAQDSLDNYWNLSTDFRQNKFAQSVGITDALNPEKQLSWYRRMVRSLSQSQTKAGAILWELVKRINNIKQIQFIDRLKELKTIQADVDSWLKGRPIQELYKKIFQYDDKGRWTGKVIQRYSRKFYEDLNKAQETGDLAWVTSNIDTVEYEKWFAKRHQELIEESKTMRVHEDDAENAKRVLEYLQSFVDRFWLGNKKSINKDNYKLKEYPLDKWESDVYKELLKADNKAVLDLYNYWRERLDESIENGMINEHNGWSWFPNVRRNVLEKLSSAKTGNKVRSVLGNLRIEVEDVTFGKIDPLTGKSIDEVHANFVTDLSEWVQDDKGDYFRDYSEKSMDIFKVIALWDQEIIKYNLKIESEALARLLYYTESHPERQALETNRAGGLKRNKETGLPNLVSNEINAKYIKEHIDAVYYGKHLANESDVSIDIPYKAAVEKINKIFGKEVLSVPTTPTIQMSGIKAIEALNRYFVAKTLGLNLFTGIAQWFGGTMNAFINQGKYFNKQDLLEAEIEYVSGRFWANDENRKMAGLIGVIHPYAEDRSEQMIRRLSVSSMVKYLSSDHLFYIQRGSDNWVNRIIAIAFFKNTMIEDGKLINIREYARKELGHSDKYKGTYQQSVEFEARLTKRIEELKKSPQALINAVKIVNDVLIIPNIEADSKTLIDFRQSILEVIKNALGNTSREDLSLYKRSVMWQSFFMFKNWIPRMADVRFQSLKFNPGTQAYEYGRARMLYRAVRHTGLFNVNSLLRRFRGDNSTIVEIAKKEYEKKKEYFASQEQEFDMDEAEFIDMYIKGVRSEFKELALALVLLGILVAARVYGPDTDDDSETKGAYRWMLRGIDKLTDEIVFFYNPKSFTDIVNGSVFPAVSFLVDVQKFLTNALLDSFYYATGNEEGTERTKTAKYFFKLFPVFKELLTYIAIFNDDIAKEYGIRISTQHGSIR